MPIRVIATEYLQPPPCYVSVKHTDVANQSDHLGDSMQYKDLQTGGFSFRFIFEEKTNEWVCKMPTWLINAAEEVLSADHKREQQLLDEDRE